MIKQDNIKYIHSEEQHNLDAPSIVVPILLELFKPKSVLDVGCGIGTWLYKFQEEGIKDVLGIDGDYVNRDLLLKYLSPDQFIPKDLTVSFDLGREFDLLLSLEVAEHLPDGSAYSFIESLCRHSDTIIFSAAIPHQGGQNHLNEQWMSYWSELFNKFNHKPYDIVRPIIWNNDKINWWYRQNIIVFSSRDLRYLQVSNRKVLDMVHPCLYMQYVEYIIYLQGYVKELQQKAHID